MIAMRYLLMIVGVLFTFTLASAQTGDENKSISYKLDEELVRKVMEPSTSEVDKANRQVMVDFIERFCTSYVVKDLGFIQNVFGEGLLSFVKGNLSFTSFGIGNFPLKFILIFKHFHF
jgi:hypothetical protein